MPQEKQATCIIRQVELRRDATHLDPLFQHKPTLLQARFSDGLAVNRDERPSLEPMPEIVDRDLHREVERSTRHRSQNDLLDNHTFRRGGARSRSGNASAGRSRIAAQNVRSVIRATAVKPRNSATLRDVTLSRPYPPVPSASLVSDGALIRATVGGVALDMWLTWGLSHS